jgi:hypothetical protein
MPRILDPGQTFLDMLYMLNDAPDYIEHELQMTGMSLALFYAVLLHKHCIANRTYVCQHKDG